jgi:hypothetical protein
VDTGHFHGVLDRSVDGWRRDHRWCDLNLRVRCEGRCRSWRCRNRADDIEGGGRPSFLALDSLQQFGELHGGRWPITRVLVHGPHEQVRQACGHANDIERSDGITQDPEDDRGRGLSVDRSERRPPSEQLVQGGSEFIDIGRR